MAGARGDNDWVPTGGVVSVASSVRLSLDSLVRVHPNLNQLTSGGQDYGQEFNGTLHSILQPFWLQLDLHFLQQHSSASHRLRPLH
jgi:hypothetical protein